MSTTRLLVTITIITLGIYDLVVVTYGGVEWSISRFISGMGSYPVPMFVFGFLAGHFWGKLSFPNVLKQRLEMERLSDDMSTFSESFYNSGVLMKAVVTEWASLPGGQRVIPPAGIVEGCDEDV